MDAVIFDYAGVLATWPTEADRARMEALAGGTDLWPVYWDLREPYDLGQVSAATYWHRVGERLGRPFGADQVEELMGGDLDMWTHANTPVLRWAAQLEQAGFRLGLISNLPHELAAGVRHLPWLPALAQVTFSCDLGTMKPDPAIYRHCLAGMGVAPERAVFLDDREENVTAAAALGLRGVHYTSIETLAADLDGAGLPHPHATAR